MTTKSEELRALRLSIKTVLADSLTAGTSIDVKSAQLAMYLHDEGYRLPAPTGVSTGPRSVGFVAVEFNQASGQPSIIGGDVYRDREDAQDIADREHTKTVQYGRRERYAVGTVEVEGEDDE